MVWWARLLRSVRKIVRLKRSKVLTGEVAASQLVDARCSLVLIGHSERRSLLVESDEVVTRKFAAAQSAGLLPVLCVGRPWLSVRLEKPSMWSLRSWLQ